MSENVCECGKSYKYFSSYKNHFIKCKKRQMIRKEAGIHIDDEPLLYISEKNKFGVDDTEITPNFDKIKDYLIQNPSFTVCECCYRILPKGYKRLHSKMCKFRYKLMPEFPVLCNLGFLDSSLRPGEITAMCIMLSKLRDMGVIKTSDEIRKLNEYQASQNT